MVNSFVSHMGRPWRMFSDTKDFFAKVKSISKESLKERLDDPNLIILDVRRPKGWKKSGIKIKVASQENPYKSKSWYARYPKNKTIILY